MLDLNLGVAVLIGRRLIQRENLFKMTVKNWPPNYRFFVWQMQTGKAIRSNAGMIWTQSCSRQNNDPTLVVFSLNFCAFRWYEAIDLTFQLRLLSTFGSYGVNTWLKAVVSNMWRQALSMWQHAVVKRYICNDN